MVRLIPKDEKFQDLFVADAEVILTAARRLEEMITAYDRLEERVAEIRALEHRGDEIDTEVQVRLDRAFITPFDREDIHDLVIHLDDVLDEIQEVAEAFIIYDISATSEDARQLAGILSAQIVQLGQAINGLDGLKGIEPHAVEVHRLENEADALSRAAIGRLFRGGFDAIDVIKWREIYSGIEEAIDAAEDAVEVIERILAKNV
jgi:predicted phosphate transport protein (TIGR00153 family)